MVRVNDVAGEREIERVQVPVLATPHPEAKDAKGNGALFPSP